MTSTSKAFLKLKEQWYQKLKASGFEDIEDSKGRLKSHDIRTQAYQDQEIIRDHFNQIEHILDSSLLPEFHRKVLSLYVEGTYITQIAVTLHVHRCTIFEILKKYRYPTLSISVEV